MIYSEIIEIIYSELENTQVFSEEEPDYRELDITLRVTEAPEPRDTENEDKRILE